MDASRTVTIPWVNDGRPFHVSKDTITSEDHRQGLLAKLAAISHASQTLPKDLPAGLATHAQLAVRELAATAQFQAILFRFVRRLDPRLKAKADDELRDLLKETEFEGFMDAAAPPPQANGAGKEAVVPLPQPPSSGV